MVPTDFKRFSSWKLLTHGIAKLIQKCRSCSKAPEEDIPKTDEFTQARTAIVKTVQQEAFQREIQSLSKGEIVSKLSPLRKLDPILDADGILRVGGRVSSATISWEERHPIIIPKSNYIATLLVQHYHERVAHQGRHITEGAVCWAVDSGRKEARNKCHI